LLFNSPLFFAVFASVLRCYLGSFVFEFSEGVNRGHTIPREICITKKGGLMVGGTNNLAIVFACMLRRSDGAYLLYAWINGLLIIYVC